MPRVLILAVMLAAGLPAVAQTPAPDPPPSSASSTNTEQKPAEAQAPPEENSQAGQPATDPSAPSEAKKEEEKKKKGALGRLKDHVKDHFSTGCVGAGTAGGCWGDGKDKKGEQKQPPADKNPAPPRSSEEGDPEFSSSRETQIDLNPPGQERPVRKSAKPADDVKELTHYDPHAAEKDVEVGEYYLKRGNLKAAIARFRSALYNKPNDALATFRLAQGLEKARHLAEARENYQRYLKILPKGEFAAECQKALERLPAPPAETAEAAPPTSAPAETLPSKR
ncbi:MAG: hypothetical protein ACRD2M_04155 [Terriglobales bacterium]